MTGVALSWMPHAAEQARLEKAVPRIPGLLEAVKEARKRELRLSLDSGDLQSACVEEGLSLWSWVKREASSDDRILYWTRLAVTKSLADRLINEGASEEITLECLDRFEAASRGRTDLSWKPDHFRLLISGFDPFQLDQNIDQSNPSGFAAVQLDDQVLIARGGKKIHVQSVVFPVRYSDFDQGTLENLLEPLLLNSDIDAFVSVSMGRDAFDLERYPGLRRSAAAPDNANQLGGGSENTPRPPLLNGRPLVGAEFLEFTLPAARMVTASGRWTVRDNRKVTTVEAGDIIVQTINELERQTAVRGSGGGYLSNEIAYRALNILQRSKANISMGHIHTPRIQSFDDQFLNEVLSQIKLMLAEIP